MERGKKALRVVLRFKELLQDVIVKKIKMREAQEAIREEFGVSRQALLSYMAAIEGVDASDWLPALIPDWSGHKNRAIAVWHPDAWDFYMEQRRNPLRPHMVAYKETERAAAAQGWGKLPSERTARTHWQDLGAVFHAEWQGDKKAQKRLLPTIQRDYSCIALNQEWSIDGRLVDVITHDDKGIYGQKGWKGRLWLYAILDARSRYIVGYVFGRELNTDLVRAGFLMAWESTGRVIPQTVQSDNGREVAAMEITGGCPWRIRGKVGENAPIGLLPMLGVNVKWAKPAHGQVKPVERVLPI